METINIEEIKPIQNPDRRNYLKISLPLVGMIVLVGGVFFTVNTALQQQQDIRSKAASANLLSNPGCEDGTNFFKGYQANISASTTITRSGNASCQIASTRGTYYDMESLQSISNPTVGQTYTGAAYVRASSNTGGKVYVALRERGGSSSSRTVYGSPVYLSTSWQLVQTTMSIQSSGRSGLDYYIVQDPGSSGQAFFADDLVFQSGSSVTQPTVAPPQPTATRIPTQAPTATRVPTQVPTATNVPTQVPTATRVPTLVPTATRAPTAVPNSPTPTPNAMITFTINKSSYNRGESMTAVWNNIPGATPRDWIGLYTPTLASGSEIGWIYVNCTQTATVAVPSGTCTFPIPDTAPGGSLELRLHSNDSTTVLKTSPLFTLAGVTPTTAPTATGAPTNPPVATNTPVPGTTLLGVNLLLHGLGKGGDAVNVGGTGNMSPLHPQKTVTVDVYDVQNQLVMSKQGTVTFNATLGNFSGNVDLGTQFNSGTYTVKVKADQYLRGLVGGIQSITRGQTTTMSTLTLVTGDVNNDNAINIVDYNIVVGCYSDLLPPVSCNAVNVIRADINDDGHVNQFDYNLFIRELTNLGGQ